MYDKCHFRPFLMLTALLWSTSGTIIVVFGHSRLTQNPTDPDGKDIALQQHGKLENVSCPTNY